MKNLNRAHAAAITTAGTLAMVMLNPVVAFAHDEEPLPLPDAAATTEAVTADKGGTPNLLIAGVVILAVFAIGAVIAGKLTKNKSADN